MFAENKKILIVGLGNIGAQYANTRHNAGFQVADALASRHKVVFSDARYGMTTQIKIKNKLIILLKPSTFMNLSGKAVLFYLEKEKIEPSAMLIIADDIALPFGQIRIRKKGGAGGHNGLQHIIDNLGSGEFARMRIGVGDTFLKGHQADYVLSPWSDEEMNNLTQITMQAADACELFVMSGPDISMNRFNKRNCLNPSEETEK